MDQAEGDLHEEVLCDKRAWSCSNLVGPLNSRRHRAEGEAAGSPGTQDEVPRCEGWNGEILVPQRGAEMAGVVGRVACRLQLERKTVSLG